METSTIHIEIKQNAADILIGKLINNSRFKNLILSSDSIELLCNNFLKQNQLQAATIYFHIHTVYKGRKIEIYQSHIRKIIALANNKKGKNHFASVEGEWKDFDSAFLGTKDWIDNNVVNNSTNKEPILFELFKNLLNVITYIFMVVPAISIVFSIFMIYSRKFDEIYLEEREKLRFAIFISAVLSVALILFPGLSHLFFFLPDNWGGLDEAGEWVSMSDSIAGLLSIYSTYLVGIMYDNYLKTIRINRKSEKNKY